ncbi:type IV toxin-antitoxin system AbiEi family antitoxin domain-containing protein [Microlunatus soli]|uniref:Transcriptional regulator, AbiEi antitoxin, Type IV TA system n=1 Tax=Microlunatus soli TaxID=630515 RepID=A0A1H1Z3M2_9ACTN|nr:type IV toxin-antitoxin system AbiEi family antitoxin domain-containing protein [Microlunatus soli]SDT28258.1 Transcriptional regulator, AbiEi antitoxin, Type IV TA system [Microlunatus soli]
MASIIGRPASTRQLRDRGFSQEQLRSLLRQGDITRLRRGAYADSGPDTDDFAAALITHRQLIMATVPLIVAGSCISHTSAAVLHDLPVPPRLGAVHVTRSRQSGQGRRTEDLHVHAAPLPDQDLCLVDGIVTTSVPRTVVDAARMLSLGRGIAMADAALRTASVTREDLIRVSVGLGKRVGMPRARTVIGMSDPRSESPGESLSRVEFQLHGLPAPDLQRELYDDSGTWVARVDFIWDAYRLVGEFDGKIKYGRYLDPDLPVQEAIYREKLREDQVRELDYRVVRWTWADIFSGAMVSRIRRAIDRTH